jgi:hypothetical protein
MKREWIETPLWQHWVITIDDREYILSNEEYKGVYKSIGNRIYDENITKEEFEMAYMVELL